LSDNYNLISYLNEIEKITDLNGCFFINVRDDKVIESTIPFKVPEKILWEIGVLRDTFRQFSRGINHGALNELMIEGDKGYILLYDIPPHLLLLAMGSEDVNLSYVRLAMIDILKRIRERLKDIGDEILTLPGKKFGLLGERGERIPTQVTSLEPETTESEEPIMEKKSEITPTQSKIMEVENQHRESIETQKYQQKEPELEKTKPIEIETTVERSVELHPIEKEKIQETKTITEKKRNLKNLIRSLEEKAGDKKYETLELIFEEFKQQLQALSGEKLFKLLEELKDAILLNIGTSLALYDISKTAKELKKIQGNLNSDDINRISKKISNWKSRIIKT